jgi:hypothetical protein
MLAYCMIVDFSPGDNLYFADPWALPTQSNFRWSSFGLIDYNSVVCKAQSFGLVATSTGAGSFLGSLPLSQTEHFSYCAKLYIFVFIDICTCVRVSPTTPRYYFIHSELRLKPLLMSILNSSVTINRAITYSAPCGRGCLPSDTISCTQQIVKYINSNLVRARQFVLCARFSGI